MLWLLPMPEERLLGGARRVEGALRRIRNRNGLEKGGKERVSHRRG
jgi:hypothetical protein